MRARPPEPRERRTQARRRRRCSEPGEARRGYGTEHADRLYPASITLACRRATLSSSPRSNAAMASLISSSNRSSGDFAKRRPPVSCAARYSARAIRAACLPGCASTSSRAFTRLSNILSILSSRPSPQGAEPGPRCSRFAGCVSGSRIASRPG